MGCGWNVTDDEMLRTVHGVEVVNGMTRSGLQWGWPLWTAWLNRGLRLTAVGGSDEHTPDETADYAIGQPTTVVWARELSESAVVEGLKSGRVYIRTQGPAGPTLEFDADVDGTAYLMGTAVPATAPIRIRLRAVVGRATGQTLQWIRNGTVMASEPIGSGRLARQVETAPGDWFSVRVVDGSDPTLIGNPVYVGPAPLRP